MAGLHLPSIQTVTAKVQLSQSSVLENIFLEDTQVCHGPVSDMINQFHLITGNPCKLKLRVSHDHISQ